MVVGCIFLSPPSTSVSQTRVMISYQCCSPPVVAPLSLCYSISRLWAPHQHIWTEPKLNHRVSQPNRKKLKKQKTKYISCCVSVSAAWCTCAVEKKRHKFVAVIGLWVCMLLTHSVAIWLCRDLSMNKVSRLPDYAFRNLHALQELWVRPASPNYLLSGNIYIHVLGIWMMPLPRATYNWLVRRDSVGKDTLALLEPVTPVKYPGNHDDMVLTDFFLRF